MKGGPTLWGANDRAQRPFRQAQGRSIESLDMGLIFMDDPSPCFTAWASYRGRVTARLRALLSTHF